MKLLCALGKVGTGIRFGVSATVTVMIAALGYGYIGETTDTTQQTNTSLAIHLHTCVATFNPTRLSRYLPTEGLLFLCLLDVCDMNSA